MNAPRFIALEGIDGAGTTSQCAAVADWLTGRGHTVHRTREPSGGAIGQLVRSHLATAADPLSADAMALLFAADRLAHVQTEIQPALDAGAVVLTDRYLLSSLAYQSLTLPLAWVLDINARAPRPDLNLLVDIPAQVGLRRVAARRQGSEEAEEIYDVPETQRQLVERYRALASRADVGAVAVIDGTPPLEAVTRAITETLIRAGL